MTQSRVPQRTDDSQQVFHAVPTNEDMVEVSGRLQQARGGQIWFLVVSIFLAGMLLAAVAGLAMLYGHMQNEQAEAERSIEALGEQVEQKDAIIAARNREIARQAGVIASYADLQSVVALREQISALEDEIAALLAEPSRANAPRSLKELPERVEWLDGTVAALAARRDVLLKKKSDIEAWPPALQNPRPD